MFTGIIQDIGLIQSVEKLGDWRFVIKTHMNLERTAIGASICCSGVCLTVTEKGNQWFAVNVSGETLKVTGADQWDEGGGLNLEPSLKLGDELGGHFVFGHVDGLAELVAVERDGDSHRLSLKAPDALAKYIARKGSVALDGISLTVNDFENHQFQVNIIPHTWENTTLQDRQVGDVLNLEIDMLARYVARAIEVQGDE